MLRDSGNPDPKLIYTQLYEAFFTRIKVAFFGGAFLGFPVIAAQIWLFVAPGLYRSEKRALLPFLLATPVLFLLGAALAYYFVFPFAWRFFASFQTTTGGGGMPIELLPRVREYLDLVMKLIFAFGLTFQMPVLLTLLAKVGITSSKGLGGFAATLSSGCSSSPRSWRRPMSSRRRARDAADRALRNLHHRGEDGGAETGGSVTPIVVAGQAWS